ncbi:endonuclease domain-containing protein [Microbacterium sp. NPDC057407]|uniref:endonuclease domain-containing protein n=1 Tax=Microbacterium sp. NPDC057407 TaxID=3346120 RepID=UPI003671F218
MDAPDDLIQAVRVGGRLTCLSLLRLLDVFVFASDRVHVHLPGNAARLRSATVAGRPLAARPDRDARLHWAPLLHPDEARSAVVGVVDAVIHAIRCQAPRYAIATLDSALNRGVIERTDLNDIFHALPAKFRALRRFIDGRAQSGPETLVRLMVLGLGCSVDLQVQIDGVGFVDLLVDEWLVIECDSRGFHDSWEQRRKDYRRDLTAATLGFVTLRLTAEDILYRPDAVLSALRGVLVHGRRP